MKRILILTAVILILSMIGSVSYSQVNEQWAARTTDTAKELTKAITTDASGNVYVTGRREYSISNWDILTAKYNSLGTEAWTRTYDGTAGGIDQGHGIAVDASGNVYVVGETESSGTGQDMIVIKYTSSGTEDWAETYDGGSVPDAGNSIAIDGAGNIVATGYSGSLTTDYDFATIKLSPAGSMVWNFGAGETAARYDGLLSGADIGLKLAIDSSNNIYVTGYSDGNADAGTINDDYATVKYNSSGAQQWAARYDGPASSGNDSPTDIGLDGSANVYVTGYSQGASGDFDYLTIKYNGSTGAESWAAPARYDGTGSDDYAYAIAVHSSGTCYVTGTSDQGSPNLDDYATVKYLGTDGAEQWVNSYNGPGDADDVAIDAVVDSDGNVYITGYSLGSTTDYDYATLKYTSAGTQSWEKRYNGPAGATDNAYAMTADSIGNIYVTGESGGIGTGQDGTVIKYSQGDDEDNIVVNPYAESGTTVPDSWTTYYNELSPEDGWATDHTHSGARSLKIVRSSSANASWRGATVYFSDPNITTLTLGGWSRAEDVAGSSGVYRLDFLVYFADGSHQWLNSGLTFNMGTHDWEKREKTFYLSKPVSSIRPYCLFYGYTGTAWFDDIFAVPSYNVIRNFRVEEGSTVPSNWKTNYNDLNNETGWATDVTRSGLRSLKIVNSTGSNARWQSDTFSFAEPYPTALTLGGWSRTEDTSGSSGIYRVQFLVYFTDGTYKWLYTSLDFSTAAHDWQKVQRTFSLTKPIVSVKAYCLFYGYTGTVWFDDVFATVPRNVILNNEMEEGTTSPYDWATYNNTLTNVTGWATDFAVSGSRSLKIVNTAGSIARWTGTTVTFSEPLPTTITAGGWSRAENVTGSSGTYRLDFLVYFTDGTYQWLNSSLSFSTGSHDWQKVQRVFYLSKPVTSIRPYCLLYGYTGTAWFDDIFAAGN